MNDIATQPPNRQQFTSYNAWRKLAIRYVKSHAPASRRIFLRGTTTSKQWHRWVLPIVFFLVGGLMLWGGISIHQDYTKLTETGTRGPLVVSDRYSQKGKNGSTTWRLMVNVDGVSTPLKGSYYNTDIEGINVGDSVDVLYRGGSEPLAWWPNDGAGGGSTGLAVFGGVVIVFAVWFGLAYKGAIEPKYLSYALGELESGRPLPV